MTEQDNIWAAKAAKVCDQINGIVPAAYIDTEAHKGIRAIQLLYAAGVPKEHLMTSQGKELAMSLVGQVELAAAMFGVTTADIAARAAAIVEGGRGAR